MNLLFEIGVEEIPSEYFELAVDSIRRKAPILLDECGYHFDEIQIYTTPRRLVIFARNFIRKSEVIEERLGPSKEQSYQNNVPSQALLGFLKSLGKTESDLKWKETSKGMRACVSVRKEVKPIKHFFETLPLQIEFPKLMRWDATNYKFTRPIRWTFAFIGDKSQKYKIASVSSDCFTFGHRFLANKKIRIKSADLISYEKLLRKNHVVLRETDRVALIKKSLAKFFNQDESLIRQVANLVEEPFPVIGKFNQDYLKLPAEVLSTCMRKHQKIFACYDRSGRLINRFVAVINGRRKDSKIIARNFENVLISRLEDAKFFYQEDLETPLREKIPKLKELIFLGGLGSYFDKVERLKKIVEYFVRYDNTAKKFFTEQIGAQEISFEATSNKIIELCKADLVTHLVYEFPELQGIAASAYAKTEGEHSYVVESIKKHYYPLNLSESHENLEKMPIHATLISLADRIDLLVGAIGLGITPTGSQDPYALRRAAGGFVKLIRASRLNFSMPDLIRTVVMLHKGLKVNSLEIERKIITFCKERIAFELNLKPGTIYYEILQSVLVINSNSIIDIFERYEELKDLYNTNKGVFLKACKVVERTGNILKGVKGESQDQIDSGMLKEELEKELYEIIRARSEELSGLARERKFYQVTERFGEYFFDPINRFFDRVMVNVEDVRIRANRQALIKKINHLYTQEVADLSLITNQ